MKNINKLIGAATLATATAFGVYQYNNSVDSVDDTNDSVDDASCAKEESDLEAAMAETDRLCQDEMTKPFSINDNGIISREWLEQAKRCVDAKQAALGLSQELGGCIVGDLNERLGEGSDVEFKFKDPTPDVLMEQNKVLQSWLDDNLNLTE